MLEYIANVALYVVPVLFAVIAHEVAHGWVAEKRGDPTARLLGRITLNPIVHIDPVGTILLPGILLLTGSPFLFGWAKPVPVNFGNLRGGRSDMALVAASGPLTNLLLAVLSAMIFHLSYVLLPETSGLEGAWSAWLKEPLREMALISVRFNIVLMVINLLPIPPLDGGRIVVGLAPRSIAYAVQRLESYGMLIVILLIGTGLWGYIVRPVVRLFWRFLL